MKGITHKMRSEYKLIAMMHKKKLLLLGQKFSILITKKYE